MTHTSESEGAPAAPPEPEAEAERAAEGESAGHDDDEPRYMAVWGGLAALTAAEVWVASLGALPKTAIVVLLVGMALWKAALVALYYMHLKFEPRSVWVLATTPLPLAVILVVAVLQEF